MRDHESEKQRAYEHGAVFAGFAAFAIPGGSTFERDGCVHESEKTRVIEASGLGRTGPGRGLLQRRNRDLRALPPVELRILVVEPQSREVGRVIPLASV